MAVDELTVLLEGRPIGSVERLANGALRLRYDEDYRDDPTATLLSVSMPPAEEAHGEARLTPWLWGLLPDNADVLARWGRDFGVSVASPFSLLSTQIGYDCAGAVQFCPADQAEDLVTRPGEITLLTEAEVALRLRVLRADSTSWLGPGFTGRSVLVEPKPRLPCTMSMGTEKPGASGERRLGRFRPPTFSNLRSLAMRRSTSMSTSA